MDGYSTASKFTLDDDETELIKCKCPDNECKYPQWLTKPCKERATLSTMIMVL